MIFHRLSWEWFLLTLLLSGMANGQDRPNFLWLISEDNSKHYLKIFDEHGVETPNIRKMAKNGLIFEHAFSNAPVCSVARTTLMTGSFAPRLGTQYHRRAKLAPLPDDLEMFPAILRRDGYYTTNNNKKDYNCVEAGDVWDESSNRASWRNRRAGQPFFHMQTLKQSHEGSLHFSRRAFENKATQTDPSDVFVAPYHPQTELFRYTNALYRDRIQVIDEQVGKIVENLRADGELENTFIFYFGDHGGVLPRSKGYLYESGLHVPLVVRVPENFRHLLEFAPEQHRRIQGFVSFIDFGPTLFNLAGLEQQASMDGQPFLGKSISLAELESRETTLGYADRFDEKSDLVRSIRKGKWKYIRNYEPFNFDGLMNNYRYQMLAYREWQSLYKQQKLDSVQSQFFQAKPAEALFDLSSDPHETKNLASEAAHRAQLIELRSELQKSLKSLPDLGFFPESHLLAQGFDNPTEFGQVHQAQLARLSDVADLALEEFDSVQEKLRLALRSEDPWMRYWALVACSSFGLEAKSLLPRIETLAAEDPENLVRVRAAEYLGITGLGDPVPIIESTLQKPNSRTEAALILNSVVMLRDGYGQSFQIRRDWFEKGAKQDNVERRLLYLLGKSDSKRP